MEIAKEGIIGEYIAFLDVKLFPCIGAKAARSKGHIRCMVADHLDCPKDDRAILAFLYDFVDEYRMEKSDFHSAAVIFANPDRISEREFDDSLWRRLGSLDRIDKQNFQHDPRVSPDPHDPHFSFSLKSEAFFILGLHPGSSRLSRRFRYPTLVFNPHNEFEKLRRARRYDSMKKTIRKRDIAFSGTINPMLSDFGEVSEVYQYSGIHYDNNWRCPLNPHRQQSEDHPAS